MVNTFSTGIGNMLVWTNASNINLLINADVYTELVFLTQVTLPIL